MSIHDGTSPEDPPWRSDRVNMVILGDEDGSVTKALKTPAEPEPNKLTMEQAITVAVTEALDQVQPVFTALAHANATVQIAIEILERQPPYDAVPLETLLPKLLEALHETRDEWVPLMERMAHMDGS